MKAAIASGSVLVALMLGLSAWHGTQTAKAGVILPWPTETSSARVLDRHAICTASVRSDVQAGQALSVKFTLHNVSRHSAEVRLMFNSTSLSLNAADGTTYDTSALAANFFSIPPPPPPKWMRAGKTWHLQTVSVPIRWAGPLRVTPKCLGKALPAISVSVLAAWPAPASSTAIAEVAAAAGHLLDHCLPQTPGVAVDGLIYPPSGTAAPMNAQCSIAIASEGGFLDAQVLVLVPDSLAGVQIFQPYETLWPNGHPVPVTLTASPPYEAIAWEFVVTRDKATPVASSTLAATSSSGHSLPSFDWNGKGFGSEGTGSCGGGSFSWGGRGPEVDFVSACSG